MCDQTEVIYSPGDVVWVKLGPIWWPGQVHDYDKLPEEITSNLRKKPIAVVKFFQEDSYEYVKNLNSIYHYNCRRKNEFIKKGLDVIRSNTRDVPSNMKMFPNDVTTAEQLTHGDPDILADEEFAPREKEDYSELFGKKTPKKGKDSAKKETAANRSRDSITKTTDRRSVSTPSGPRLITHRRFITKAIEGRSDHEVRIRRQTIERDRSNDSSKLYNCHLCGFSSSRINVIVLHNKSHSAGFADAYLHPQKLLGKSGKKAKGEKRITFSGDKRQRAYDTSKSEEPVPKKKVTRKEPKESSDLSESTTKTGQQSDPEVDLSPIKKPVFGRKKSAKSKAEKLAREKQQNDEFRQNLLKDWDDEDVEDEDMADISCEKDNSFDDSPVKGPAGKDDIPTKTKKTSCFDFDDSEDGLNIGETVMKFGQKIPRILGEKTRKQSEQVSLNESDQTNEDTPNADEEVETRESQDISKAETGKDGEDPDAEAFKSLLDETVVPALPEVPTHLDIKKISNLESENISNNDVEVKDTSSDSINQVVDDGGGEIDEGGGINASLPVDVLDDTNVTASGVIGTSADNKCESIDSNKDLVNKDDSVSDSEHFLVKTSEEVATSSSDNVHLEGDSSPNPNNVAKVNEVIANDNLEMMTLSPSIDNISNLKENTTLEDVDIAAVISSTHNNFTSAISPTLDVNPVEISNTGNTIDIERSIDDGNLKLNTSTANTVTMTVSQSPSAVQTVSSIIEEAVKYENTSKSVTQDKAEISCFQDMDFDINSMPVIIGDEMVAAVHEPSVAFSSSPISEPEVLSQTTCLSTLPKTLTAPNFDSELITIKRGGRKTINNIESVIPSKKMNVKVKEDISYGSQSNVIGKESKLATKTMILSPTNTVAATRPTQVATIKVQPSTATAINRLSVPGSMIAQKGVVGGTSQVLILKSANSSGKTTLQKVGATSQLIQQGGKVLILTNPQASSSPTKLLTQKGISAGNLGSTRILTTKGTVLTTTTPVASTKANILSASTKTVTTKSGQKILINNKANVLSPTSKGVIFNKGGLLTAVGTPTVIASKSPMISPNMLTSKSDTVVTSQMNLTQFAVSGPSKVTTANIMSTPGLTANKSNMVLTPVSIGKNSSLAGGQKLKLINSKVNTVMSTGTKLMVQATPSRVILPSSTLQKNQLKLVGNLKNQPNTNTFLIQTSQGVIATTPLSSSQVVTKTKPTTQTIIPKPSSIHVTQSTLPSPSKLVVQKVKAGPNILQKTQRKPAQRSNKRTAASNQLLAAPQQNIQTTLLTSANINQEGTSSVQDTLILTPTSGIVTNTQVDSNQQPALVYLAVDESGNYRPLESAPVMATDSQTLYIDPGSSGADLDNIFLAIDEAGNVVNISQPVQAQTTVYTTENSTPPPSQDILAKALADTQVLQQEPLTESNLSTDNTLVTSIDSTTLANCMFVEQPSQYPQQTLSHSVLETSLTLNQAPIMTPLEVPSAVSPGSLGHIPSMHSGFLTDSGLLTSPKEKKVEVHQSMPLLTDETGRSPGVKNETVYFTQVDGSHAVLTPVSTGSQLSFQLALDGNNVIVSSPGLSSLGATISNSLDRQSNFPSATESKPQLEFSTIVQDNGSITSTELNPANSVSGVASSTTADNIVLEIPVQSHASSEIDEHTLKEVEDIGNMTISPQQSTEIKIKVDCSDVSIDQGENHRTGLVTDGSPHVAGEHNVNEAFENVVTEVAFSNGDITQRVVTKRHSDDSAGLLVAENGSDYKRVKLDER